MSKKIIFVISFILLIIIGVLNHIASINFLYWKIWWFDILMHFLGGLWVGLFSLSLFFNWSKLEKKDFVFLFSFFAVFVVGVGWEVFEYFIDVNFSEGYWRDTLSDLLMDFIGSLIASFVFIFRKK